MSEDETNTGALSAAGRFARMEAALDRIETKLDNKADESEMMIIAGRLIALETDKANREVLSVALKESSDNKYRMIWIVVGFLTIINIVLGGVLSFIAMFSHTF